MQQDINNNLKESEFYAQNINKQYDLVEFEWKFNHRNFKGNELDDFLKQAVTHEKELLYWKAKSTQEVKEVAYA